MGEQPGLAPASWCKIHSILAGHTVNAQEHRTVLLFRNGLLAARCQQRPLPSVVVSYPVRVRGGVLLSAPAAATQRPVARLQSVIALTLCGCWSPREPLLCASGSCQTGAPLSEGVAIGSWAVGVDRGSVGRGVQLIYRAADAAGLGQPPSVPSVDQRELFRSAPRCTPPVQGDAPRRHKDQCGGADWASWTMQTPQTWPMGDEGGS